MTEIDVRTGARLKSEDLGIPESLEVYAHGDIIVFYDPVRNRHTSTLMINCHEHVRAALVNLGYESALAP